MYKSYSMVYTDKKGEQHCKWGACVDSKIDKIGESIVKDNNVTSIKYYYKTLAEKGIR